jgi:hypothetical protein
MTPVTRNTTKVRSEADDEEAMALSVEVQLVHYKLERPSLTVDLRIFCTFGRWQTTTNCFNLPSSV